MRFRLKPSAVTRQPSVFGREGEIRRFWPKAEGRGLKAALFAATLLVFMAIVSCSIVRTFFVSDRPPPRPFNHAAHIERGLSCGDCHANTETEAGAGMPSVASCMECHEEIDADPDRPREQKVAWFLDASGNPQWSTFTKQSKEIRFSHSNHTRAQVSCESCHADVTSVIDLVPGMLQRMDSCVSCHQQTASSKNDCSTCHREIRRESAPENHARMWKQQHGRCAREAGATVNQCRLCHGTDECASCHQTEEPADHNEHWRMRSHGIAASVDRQRCSVCHESDSCVRCHQDTAPVSHAAGWDAPSNRHCGSCHVPLQSSGSCFVCHRSTPGHAAAPAKPSWHNSSMNCRACHSTSLTHPDNGDNCNTCHQ